MNLRKEVDQEDFEGLCRATGAAFRGAVALWKAGMKVFPINSKEYRSLCSAGEKIQDLHFALVSEAQRRGVSATEIREIFGEGFDCSVSFN